MYRVDKITEQIQPSPKRAAKLTLLFQITNVSGEKQEYNTSLDEQKKAINAYGIRQGYSMSEEHLYTDIMTGIEAAWRDRVDLQKMLEAAKSNEFDVVVVHHTDRLARGELLIIITTSRSGISDA